MMIVFRYRYYKSIHSLNYSDGESHLPETMGDNVDNDNDDLVSRQCEMMLVKNNH